MYLPTLCALLVRGSDVVLKTDLKTIFEVLVLAKADLVLVMTMNGLKNLKNCGLKTKKVLRSFFRHKRSYNPNFGQSQISVLNILILDEAKVD